jgi:hypothetical protein
VAEELTTKDVQAIALLATGVGENIAAEKMGLSKNALHTRKNKAFRIMGAENVAHCVDLMWRTGLLPLDQKLPADDKRWWQSFDDSKNLDDVLERGAATVLERPWIPMLFTPEWNYPLHRTFETKEACDTWIAENVAGRPQVISN